MCTPLSMLGSDFQVFVLFIRMNMKIVKHDFCNSIFSNLQYNLIRALIVKIFKFIF